MFLGQKKSIYFNLKSIKKEIQCWFDTDAMEKILNNLLSNAFKFTPIDGSIDVAIFDGSEYNFPKNETIENIDDYVVIHTSEASHIKQDRINNFEKLLDATQFCRIHRSTIINLDYLKGIETEAKDSRFANMKLTEKTAKQFAISRSGYTKLLTVL